jgi:hypothetical protein
MISVSGSVGGSPDGNPEHGSLTQVDREFNTVAELILFLKNIIGFSHNGNSQGNLTISWFDEEE